MGFGQTVSVWMTVCMSLHRFVGVCLPFKAATLLNKRRAKSAIAGVVLFALVYNLPRFFEVTVLRSCWYENIGAELPILSATPMRDHPLYVLVFYQLSYTLLMFLIPFTVLIVVNSLVILAIHRSRQVHAKLNVCDDGTRKQEIAKEISTSVMLVAIVLAFLLCNTLVSAEGKFSGTFRS